MGKSHFTALMAPIIIAATISGARAQECPPLRQVISVPITMKNSRILVPVSINGTEKLFMLDTGGAVSQIAPSLADELKLVRNESNVRLWDLYGNASAQAVNVTFALGGLQDRNASLQVSPRDFADEPYVGIIAADYMGRYDVELDLAGGKMNYFSTDHCEGRVVYWPAAAVAVIPFRLQNSHIEVSATLNDREVKAIVDTGAPTSVLRADTAKRLFDLTVDTPGNTDIREFPDGHKEFQHVFRSLALEGLAVGNPRIVVMPDMVGLRNPNNDFVTGTRTRRVADVFDSDPPLIIGMNVISRLRIYIAFKEGNMYVTPPVRTAAPPAANGN
jgi:predicted aspartyl protease